MAKIKRVPEQVLPANFVNGQRLNDEDLNKIIRILREGINLNKNDIDLIITGNEEGLVFYDVRLSEISHQGIDGDLGCLIDSNGLQLIEKASGSWTVKDKLDLTTLYKRIKDIDKTDEEQDEKIAMLQRLIEDLQAVTEKLEREKATKVEVDVIRKFTEELDEKKATKVEVDVIRKFTEELDEKKVNRPELMPYALTREVIELIRKHNEDEEAHDYILRLIASASIGAVKPLVFNTEKDIVFWLASKTEKHQYVLPRELRIGQILYTIDEDEADYWVSKVPVNVLADLTPMHGLIDLSNYATLADLAKKAGLKEDNYFEGKNTFKDIISLVTDLGEIGVIGLKFEKGYGTDSFLGTNGQGNVVYISKDEDIEVAALTVNTKTRTVGVHNTLVVDGVAQFRDDIQLVGNISMEGGTIGGLADGENPLDAVNKQQLDKAVSAYKVHAAKIYYDAGFEEVFNKAWAHSLTVGLEPSKADYPNAETEGVIIPYGVEYIDNNDFNDMQTVDTPLVLPNTITIISLGGFQLWSNNNQTLIIPESVTSIDGFAFSYWIKNNKPLMLPDSVKTIFSSAFENWHENTYPLIIPKNVTQIGTAAFADWRKVPYVIMHPATPPQLNSFSAFANQNNVPIYVPTEHYHRYIVAPMWSTIAARIRPISELNRSVDLDNTQVVFGSKTFTGNNEFTKPLKIVGGIADNDAADIGQVKATVAIKQDKKPDGVNELILNGKLNEVYSNVEGGPGGGGDVTQAGDNIFTGNNMFTQPLEVKSVSMGGETGPTISMDDNQFSKFSTRNGYVSIGANNNSAIFITDKTKFSMNRGLELNSNKLENLAEGEADNDAVNKGQLDAAIESVVGGEMFIVITHISEVTKENKIYLLPKEVPGTNDVFEEYALIDGEVEKLGEVTVDLSDYYNKTQSDERFARLTTNNIFSGGNRFTTHITGTGLYNLSGNNIVSELGSTNIFGSDKRTTVINSGSPIRANQPIEVPNAVADAQAINRGQMNTQNALNAKLASNQTFTGDNTFNKSVNFSNGIRTNSILDYTAGHSMLRLLDNKYRLGGDAFPLSLEGKTSLDFLINGQSRMSLIGSGLYCAVPVIIENDLILTKGTNSTLKVTTPTGWVNIGSQSSNTAHFRTDRNQYDFDKPVGGLRATNDTQYTTKGQMDAAIAAGSGGVWREVLRTSIEQELNFFTIQEYGLKEVYITMDYIGFQSIHFPRINEYESLKSNVTLGTMLEEGNHSNVKYMAVSLHNVLEYYTLKIEWFNGAPSYTPDIIVYAR